MIIPDKILIHMNAQNFLITRHFYIQIIECNF